ncbi:Nitroreductase [Mycena kentingensis (nom. inval.)]|nr:Nitroreductase [Mycena kentingensis (nom. inval.)]
MPTNDRPDPHLSQTVDALIKDRFSARFFLPTPVDRQIIEEVVDAARYAPSGVNMQPWKVHCLAGPAKDALAADMLQTHERKAEGTARYAYWPTPLPDEYAERRREFGKFFYGRQGIEYRNEDARAASDARNYKFFDAPIAFIFTIHQDLGVGSWLDLGHFMQSISLGLRARGLESVSQLSIPKFDAIIRQHLPIPEDELVACGMSVGYPDLARVEQSYARPPRRALGEILQFHGL